MPYRLPLSQELLWRQVLHRLPVPQELVWRQLLLVPLEYCDDGNCHTDWRCHIGPV